MALRILSLPDLCRRRSATSFQFTTSEAAIVVLEQLGYIRTKGKARKNEAGRWINTSAVAIVYTSGSVVAAGERAGLLVSHLARLAGEPIGQLYIAIRSPDHLSEYLWCSHPPRFAAALELAGWKHWSNAEQEEDQAGHRPSWVLCAPGRERFSAIRCSHAGVLKLLGNDWDAWPLIEPYIYYVETRS